MLMLMLMVTDALSSLSLAPNQTDWGGNHHAYTHARYPNANAQPNQYSNA